MTVTSNLHIGISAWAGGQSYSVGNRISNGGNAYQCVQAGTSGLSGGPSGTGTSIVDGSCRWNYLSSVDYTTISAWLASIPSTRTQAYTGLLWNDGQITTPTNTPFAQFTGHAGGSSTNLITLTCAPGESFTAGKGPLTYNASAGVSFLAPSSSGSVNYFWIDDSYVVLDGLQIKDPLSTSGCTLIGGGGANITVRNCIIDGYSQSGGAFLVQLNAGNAASGITFANCVIFDRGNGGVTPTVQFGSTGGGYVAVNNTFVLVTYAANAGALDAGNNVTAQSVLARNNIFINYDWPVVANSGNNQWAYDHNAATAASFPSGNGNGTDNGGSIYSLTVANEFVGSITSDVRLKWGARCADTGATDLTDLPSATDVFGTARPQGAAWDIGAFELVPPHQLGTARARGKVTGFTAQIPTRGSGKSRGKLTTAVLSTALGPARSRAAGSGRLAPLLSVSLGPSRGRAAGRILGATPDPFSSDFSADFGGGGPTSLGMSLSAPLVGRGAAQARGAAASVYLSLLAARSRATAKAQAAITVARLLTGAGKGTARGTFAAQTFAIPFTAAGRAAARGRVPFGILISAGQVVYGTSGSLTDGSSNVWTISAGGEVLENGSAPAFSANVVLIALVNGVIYQKNASSQWYYWSGSAWTATADPIPAGPVGAAAARGAASVAAKTALSGISRSSARGILGAVSFATGARGRGLGRARAALSVSLSSAFGFAASRGGALEGAVEALLGSSSAAAHGAFGPFSGSLALAASGISHSFGLTHSVASRPITARGAAAGQGTQSTFFLRATGLAGSGGKSSSIAARPLAAVGHGAMRGRTLPLNSAVAFGTGMSRGAGAIMGRASFTPSHGEGAASGRGVVSAAAGMIARGSGESSGTIPASMTFLTRGLSAARGRGAGVASLSVTGAGFSTASGIASPAGTAALKSGSISAGSGAGSPALTTALAAISSGAGRGGASVLKIGAMAARVRAAGHGRSLITAAVSVTAAGRAASRGIAPLVAGLAGHGVAAAAGRVIAGPAAIIAAFGRAAARAAGAVIPFWLLGSRSISAASGHMHAVLSSSATGMGGAFGRSALSISLRPASGQARGFGQGTALPLTLIAAKGRAKAGGAFAAPSFSLNAGGAGASRGALFRRQALSGSGSSAAYGLTIVSPWRFITPDETGAALSTLTELPFFDPAIVYDQDYYVFDWGERAGTSSDPIQTATVTATPSTIGIGAPEIAGDQVRVLVGSGTPGTYSLRCSITLLSGRVLHWSVPLQVEATDVPGGSLPGAVDFSDPDDSAIVALF